MSINDKTNPSYPVELDVVYAEKIVKNPLRASDPGRTDLSEDFFNRLHDKIMAEVANTEIQPKGSYRPMGLAWNLPEKWRMWWEKSSPKTGMPMLILFLFSCTFAAHLMSGAPGTSTVLAQANISEFDQMLSETLSSPGEIDHFVAANPAGRDFFVDLTSRTFDHFQLNEIEGLLAETTIHN
jgi:hypothetical protein